MDDACRFCGNSHGGWLRPGYVGVYARTAPPPIRVETYGPAPGPDTFGSTDIGVIAATTTIGIPDVGNVRRADAAAGRMAAGNTAATATSGARAAGARVCYG